MYDDLTDWASHSAGSVVVSWLHRRTDHTKSDAVSCNHYPLLLKYGSAAAQVTCRANHGNLQFPPWLRQWQVKVCILPIHRTCHGWVYWPFVEFTQWVLGFGVGVQGSITGWPHSEFPAIIISSYCHIIIVAITSTESCPDMAISELLNMTSFQTDPAQPYAGWSTHSHLLPIEQHWEEKEKWRELRGEELRGRLEDQFSKAGYGCCATNIMMLVMDW